VTNTGDVDLAAVQVTDPALRAAVSCPTPKAPGLAPGASETCTTTSTHTVTQADIDTGRVTDVASAIGTIPNGPPTPLTTGTATVTASQAPAVAIKKTATVVPKTDQKAVKLSDRITYTYLVTNTGNVDLVKIAVSDPSLGAVDCPIPVPPGLAPGASETCRGEIQHVVSKKDITAGHIKDTATATGTDSSGQTSSNSSPSTATVDSAHATKKPKPKGRLTLTKTASDSQPTGGQDVTYTLT